MSNEYIPDLVHTPIFGTMALTAIESPANTLLR